MVDYWTALPLGIAIGTAFVALAYLISHWLNSEPLKAYAKLELGELVFSAIMVLVVVAAFDAAPGVLAGVLHASTGSYGVAQAGEQLHGQLEVPLQNALDSLMRDTFRLTKIISYNYNGQLTIPFISPMYSSSPGAGASPLMLQLQMGMDSTSMTLMLLRGLRIGAAMLDFAVRLLLLPLAIILRFIPPTRRLGGLLMGISLAVHLAFPASVGLGLELSNAFAGGIPQSIPLIADPGTPPGRGVICSPIMQGFYTIGEITAPDLIARWSCAPVLATPFVGLQLYLICVGKVATPAPIDPSAFGVSGLVSNLWYLAGLLFQGLSTLLLSYSSVNLTPDEISSQVYWPLVHDALPAVVSLNLIAIILAILVLASTVVLARNFAQVLGGEGQFYGLAKLV